MKASDLPVFTLDKQRRAREAMETDPVEFREGDTQGSIRPQKALWDVRQVMGREDNLLFDAGAHTMWIARHYSLPP